MGGAEGFRIALVQSQLVVFAESGRAQKKLGATRCTFGRNVAYMLLTCCLHVAYMLLTCWPNLG